MTAIDLVFEERPHDARRVVEIVDRLDTSPSGLGVDEARRRLDRGARRDRNVRRHGERVRVNAELIDDIAEIEERWIELAEDVTTIAVGLEANDVKVAQLSLTWIPVD